MKSIQLLVVGALAMLCACQPSKQSNLYTVTGELEDSAHHGKKIYIMNYDGNKLMDSTFVEGNKFVFKGEIDTAVYCRIDVSRSIFGNIILESGDIKVNLKENNQPSGTPMNDEMRKIIQEEDSLFSYVAQKQEEIEKQYSDTEKALELMMEVGQQFNENLAVRAKELFALHNNDAVGYFLLYRMFWDILDTDAKIQTVSTFGSWLKSRYKVRDMLKRFEIWKKTAVGMPFTDIKGKDAKGNPVALSDYVGKGNYVLLDMWASWCGPCKGEIPNLLKLHDQYKDKGLTVLGLFVWDKDKNLEKAVKEEGIVWPQIIDTEMAAENKYGVDGIPHIILFAPDGTILKRDLRGQNMIDTVDGVMKKK